MIVLALRNKESSQKGSKESFKKRFEKNKKVVDKHDEL